jgi:hypothetical protein
VTVEMPIVCVTDAAGLGTLGVVITPCAKMVIDSSTNDSTATDLRMDSFSISCVFKVKEQINVHLIKTRFIHNWQTVIVIVKRPEKRFEYFKMWIRGKYLPYWFTVMRPRFTTCILITVF